NKPNTIIPIDFDLPERNLSDGHDYVPPKARRSPEIARRQARPAGSLLAEQQFTGLRMASEIVRQPQDVESWRFSAQILAASGLNTAWYSFARQAPVMRRRLKLPVIASADELIEVGEGSEVIVAEPRPSSADMLQTVNDELMITSDFAERLAAATERQAPKLDKYNIWLGRQIGNTSLRLACVEMADRYNDPACYGPGEVQLAVRDQALQTLQQSRQLADTIGSHPSMAQLAVPDSDLAVFWRRSAPNGAFDAYSAAADSVFST
ncbi:MAG: hypothetical protein ABI221_03310, partial [Candidatus Saccharimonadales bacterium]